MPQTIESIKHAKAADVPIIVAINKIDKPQANPQKVRTDLLQHEVFVESMGGETLDVEVSALKHSQSRQAARDHPAAGRTARHSKPIPKAVPKASSSRPSSTRAAAQWRPFWCSAARSMSATSLSRASELARVRALIDDKGEQIKTAGPSMPVEVLGFSGVPDAGDRFSVVENEARAREVTEYRQRQLREKSAVGGATSLEQMMNQLKASGMSKFPLVIKADVQGSAEAITSSLDKLGTDEVSAQILMSGVGGITESDVTLAAASNAIVIGFNVRANKQARELAERDGIEIRYYNIIYDLVDDVKTGHVGPAWRRSAARPSSAMPRSSKSSTSPRSARSPAAGSPKAWWNAAPACACCATTSSSTKASSRPSSASRTKSSAGAVRPGMRHGLRELPGHRVRATVIECFRVETVQRTL